MGHYCFLVMESLGGALGQSQKSGLERRDLNLNKACSIYRLFSLPSESLPLQEGEAAWGPGLGTTHALSWLSQRPGMWQVLIRRGPWSPRTSPAPLYSRDLYPEPHLLSTLMLLCFLQVTWMSAWQPPTWRTSCTAHRRTCSSSSGNMPAHSRGSMLRSGGCSSTAQVGAGRSRCRGAPGPPHLHPCQPSHHPASLPEALSTQLPPCPRRAGAPALTTAQSQSRGSCSRALLCCWGVRGR